MKTIAIAGTFDSKGEEFLYVKKLVEKLGLQTYMIHTGVFEPAFEPDVSNREVAEAAGYDIDKIVEKKDRALATEALSNGMKVLVPQLYKEGKFDGILSFGGSGGTSLVTPAMQKLPIGVPKLMVSTMASGDVERYVGTSDILMMPSIVDVAGINKISKIIFKNAVLTIAGMVAGQEKLAEEETIEEKPLIAASMFGVTTPCVEQAKAVLEQAGYEVLVFHATGTGGKTMESLIESGFFTGVLDLTTTEWCDEVVGGILAAGEDRCRAAIRKKIPQVVSVGACDMVNFGPIDEVPKQFAGRNLYKHNPLVTLMRTSVEENKVIAEKLAERWNETENKMILFLPKQGVSMIDAKGQPFDGPEERKVLFDTLKNNISNENVEIVEMDNNINDEAFAKAAAQKLMELINEGK